MEKLTQTAALTLLARSAFREFTKVDWHAFAGCETRDPLICDTRRDWVIVIDGASATFYPVNEADQIEDIWYRFELKD